MAQPSLKHAAETDVPGLIFAEGTLLAIFSFDVGYEIALEDLYGRLPGGPGVKSPEAACRRDPSPLVWPLGTRSIAFADRRADADVTLRIHEFGAVTVLFGVGFHDEEGTRLADLTAALAASSRLEEEARAVLREAYPRLAAAVHRPNPDGFGPVEDYYVVQVGRLSPSLPAAAVLEEHGDLLARILHGERGPLSVSETGEILRTAVTYSPRDLVVTDWNVALVFDDEYAPVLDVIDLLNVQLLELRCVDAMLDRRIAALYEYVARPLRLFARRRESARVRELSELWLDTVTLRERLLNALKLVGDLYLGKIYTRTAERLQLAQWQRSIDAKLDLVQKISDVSMSRAATARAEILELAIIILIAIDILIYLL